MLNICLTSVLLSQVYGNWPMWGATPKHKSVQRMPGAITTPVIKWRFATGGGVEYQFSAVDDVDGDGQIEVVIGSLDRKVYCINGSTGAQEWAFTTGGEVWSSPAIADVDGDGYKEVVVGSYDDKVYCLRGSDGAKKWEFTTGGNVQSSPAVADVDGDGQIEVVVGSWNSRVYCLHGSDGGQKWLFSAGNRVISSPALDDVDGDGQIEVVIGSSDGRVYCLRGSDGVKKWEFLTGGIVQSSPAISDVDGDGNLDVVIGSWDKKVYCLRGSDGVKKWEFATGDSVWSSAAISDVDGDGHREVLIGSNDRMVYCLRGSDGTPKWSSGPFQSAVHLPGSLADIDGDGRFELLVSQYSLTIPPAVDTLYCLNAENGSVAWKIGLAYDVHTPVAADIDGDGCIEVITGTAQDDAQGYRFFAIDDPANTMGCGDLYDDIEEGYGPGSLDFRPQGKGLYLSMPREAQVSLNLYDASGKLVQRLYDGVLAQGGHSFIPNTGTKGVYLAVLRYQGGMKTLRIMR